MDTRNSLDQVIAMEVALGWERQMKRIMEESLWEDELALQEKMQEHSVLMADKERMLAVADIETTGKLIDDFMVFIGSVEKNDLEKVQKFDEKSMMDAVATMINGHGNYRDVFGAEGNNELVIAQIPFEAVAGAQAIEGTKTDEVECSQAGGNSGN